MIDFVKTKTYKFYKSMDIFNFLSEKERFEFFYIKNKNFISSYESNDFDLEEIYTKIFFKNMICKQDSDEKFNLEEKQKDTTLDKTKFENIDKKEDNFSDISFIVDLVGLNLNRENDSETKSFNEIVREQSNIFTTEPKLEIIINNSENNYLGKKRNLFKINSSKDFFIFNPGESDKMERKLINEIIEEFSENGLKEDEEITIEKFIKKNCKKINNERNRKGNADNIRKKVKSRFFKAIKKNVNSKLKKEGSRKIFKNLSQKFITNVKKDKNNYLFELSLEDLLKINFYEEEEEEEEKGKNSCNYEHNQKVLKYLEKKNEISIKSDFSKSKNRKIKEIFHEYLNSKEFEDEIVDLKKNENDKYVKDFIIKAISLMKFFSN